MELGLREGTTLIPARVVSEGTLRILGLLALAGTKEPPALIGFEEPENGVHPRRLQLIAELLQTRADLGDTQMIVTTHSPLLVDLIPDQFLYVCHKHDGGTQIEPFTSLKLWRNKEVSQALEDDEQALSVSRRSCVEISMRNVALFVEDFAHEIFLRAMVQRFGKEHHLEVAFRPYSVRGGFGKVVKELRQFLSDLECGRRGCPTC